MLIYFTIILWYNRLVVDFHPKGRINMKKIVILGCENSHADIFLGIMKDNPKYKDVECIGVYSHEDEPMRALQEKYGVKAMSSYDEAACSADGVIITARHGDNHYKYAKPYIKRGVPMFIDKPVTISESDALRLIAECRECGARLTGGSSLIHEDIVRELRADAMSGFDGATLSGFVRCPLSLSSPNGGFYFYAEHLVGIVTSIFGYYPRSVMALDKDGRITVIFRYDGYDITGLYLDNNYSSYYAMRVSETRNKGGEFTVSGDSPCFERELSEFYSLLSGEDMPRSYEEIISPVFIMNAIERSLKSGKEECVSVVS